MYWKPRLPGFSDIFLFFPQVGLGSACKPTPLNFESRFLKKKVDLYAAIYGSWKHWAKLMRSPHLAVVCSFPLLCRTAIAAVSIFVHFYPFHHLLHFTSQVLKFGKNWKGHYPTPILTQVVPCEVYGTNCQHRTCRKRLWTLVNCVLVPIFSDNPSQRSNCSIHLWFPSM